MQLAIVGAGWAGLACALEAVQAGHQVTVYEATRHLGGRARAITTRLPDGRQVLLDNGQHILIGAYTETLRLMQGLGLDPKQSMRRMPLTLRWPDRTGIEFPDWPMPFDALAGILCAPGWSWTARLGLLRAAWGWQRQGFQCDPRLTVADLCGKLAPQVLDQLITPLCVSALNTPPELASAQVFLHVMQDSLLGATGGSHLLLPRTNLGALFPEPAANFLQQAGSEVLLGQRIEHLTHQHDHWRLDGRPFDAIVLATPPAESVRLLSDTRQIFPTTNATAMKSWAVQLKNLTFQAITTVYAWADQAALPYPMMALRTGVDSPAQFVFDRGQLDGIHGLMAFVISTSAMDRGQIEARVLQQSRVQLGLNLQAVLTVAEKRATFSCTPDRAHPPQVIAPGLSACGDYLYPPYPATLEAAVRSGVAAARLLPAA